MEERKMICQECHAIIKMAEYHPYTYCLLAKAYPNSWKQLISQLKKDFKEAKKNG